MTQTISSRKRSRDLEDADLLPSPKRIDFNLNSSNLHVNNHIEGDDESDGSSRFLPNGACYNSQSSTQHHPPTTSPHHQPTPSNFHHTTPPSLHPESLQNGVPLDPSTCTALSNLHLMPQDQTEVTPCHNDPPANDNSVYQDINRVLRSAHFSRLERLNSGYRE